MKAEEWVIAMRRLDMTKSLPSMLSVDADLHRALVALAASDNNLVVRNGQLLFRGNLVRVEP